MLLNKQIASKLTIFFLCFSLISSKFLQNSQKICLSPKVKALRKLLNYDEEDKKYNSTLTPEERKNYEDMINKKKQFTKSMQGMIDVDESFEPEKKSYWSGLNKITVTFTIIAIFPFTFIVFYLIMRFVFKKCTGPQKTSQVSRIYRNLAWVMMIGATISCFILYTIILSNSVNSKAAIKNTFDVATTQISKTEQLYKPVNDLITKIRGDFPDAVPSESYMENFKKSIDKYISDSKIRTEQMIDDESARNVWLILLYVYYLLLLISGYVAFFLKMEKVESVLAILAFFTIPAMIIFEGYNTKFYFFYSDICGTVHGALYEEEFPVANLGLGYYFNCFDKSTKSNLYTINYMLTQASDEVKAKYQSDIETVIEQYLEPQFNCKIIYDVVPTLESEFCKNGLEWFYDLVIDMTFLCFFTLFLAMGLGRLEVLIWKKRTEIESMIMNQEALY